MDRLDLPHGPLALPAFMPDATFGFVRGLSAADLAAAGVRVLMMNAFHLMTSPGASVVRDLGGLHAMYGWDGPICTDSGGFQAFSLLAGNPKAGSFTKKGLAIRPMGRDKKIDLTPERAIEVQFGMGADLLFCLDVCTTPDAPAAAQADAVDLTIEWGRRCRETFDRLVKERRPAKRPLLFAVIQGGADPAERRRCAAGLVDLGFDGFGFGGYPFDRDGNLVEAPLDAVRDAVPAGAPLFALGVGSFEAVRAFHARGFRIFDCALPTRDARRGRLYTLDGDRPGRIYLEDERHVRARGPVSPGCDCAACAGHSLGFLRHLFVREDPLLVRLASIHNLRVLTRFVETLGC